MGNTITALELNDLLKEKTDMQLIDVRETYEHEEYNIGGLNIPLKTLLDNISTLDSSKITVIYCQAGGRSNMACQKMQEQGFTNVLNLIGGMNMWRATI